MEISVVFFGILAEITGKKTVILSGVKDTASLQNDLYDKFPKLKEYKYIIAINNQKIDENVSLKNDDMVVFIPPFAGG